LKATQIELFDALLGPGNNEVVLPLLYLGGKNSLSFITL